MSNNQPPPGPPQGPYGQQPPQGPPPGYGQQPPYGPPPGYGQQPPQGPPPGYGQQPPQGPPPGYGQQQPGGWGNQPPPYGQGPWTTATGGPPEPKKRRKGLILGSVGAAVVLVLAGSGAFAYQQLSGGGAQPSEALPDSTIAYARVDLDPSASQKVNIVRLLRKIPEFSEATGIDSNKEDLRKRLFDEALKDEDCKVDYEDDVEPWIGDRAAVAAVPDGDKPAPVVVLQTKDSDAAKKGIEKLKGCGGSDDEDTGVAFVDDYAVLAETQSIASDAAKGAEKAPLSEEDDFTETMDKVGDQGVMSFWADGEEATKLAEKAGGSDADSFKEFGGKVETIGGAIRAGSDYIEMPVVAKVDDFEKPKATSKVGDLPASTVAAASVAGGSDAVDKAWSAMTDSLGPYSSFQDDLDEMERALGISLPDDLKTLFGDDITIAVDEEGLDSVTGLDDPDDLAKLNVGIRSVSDTDDLKSLVGKINTALSGQGIPQLATKETDDGLVAATNDDYADKLAGDGDLGSESAFKKVVPDVGGSTSVIYLNMDKVQAIAEDVAQESGDSSDDIKAVEPIQAFGMSSGFDGDYSTATLRVSFD